ncbi:MAG: hypothetical protein N3A38_06875 [Planctomycetota bacterium]|nr:hypothetical protein [Planctomycetota bacterium]
MAGGEMSASPPVLPHRPAVAFRRGGRLIPPSATGFLNLAALAVFLGGCSGGMGEGRADGGSGAASGGRAAEDQGGLRRTARQADLPAFPVRISAPEKPVELPIARDATGQLDVAEMPGPDGNALRMVLETGASVSVLSERAVARFQPRHMGVARIALGLGGRMEDRCDVWRLEKAVIGGAGIEDWTVVSGAADIFARTGADGLLGADVLCGGAAFGWEPGGRRFWIARSLEDIETAAGPAATKLPLVPPPARKIFRLVVRLNVDGTGEALFMLDSGSNKSLLVFPDEAALTKAAKRVIERNAGRAEAQGPDGKMRLVPVHRISVNLDPAAGGEEEGGGRWKDVEVFAYADGRGHCGTVNVIGSDAEGRETPVYRQGVLGVPFLRLFSYFAFDRASNRIWFGPPAKR